LLKKINTVIGPLRGRSSFEWAQENTNPSPYYHMHKTNASKTWHLGEKKLKWPYD